MNDSFSWSPSGENDYFLRGAQEAERYAQEVRGKVTSNPSYKRVHDEHLAKFYVYNYLHGRTCLSSRDELLAELKRMLELSVSDTSAYDADQFERFRVSYINELIRRYEAPSRS